MAKHKRISIHFSPRFRDLDAMGHVNNAVYFTYFEEGRAAFLKRVLEVVEPWQYMFILANIRCEFQKPIKLRDELRLNLWIGKVGRKSFTFQYELSDKDHGDTIYAKGDSVQVYFDYKTGKTKDLPAEFIEKISPYFKR